MDLSAEPPFRLGAVRIDPARLQVAWRGGGVDVQPRAMQVLVRLARSAGAVVSRDALIEACWDSRAVSDDSIHRVVHLLRRVARQSCGQGFSIHTVPKVGYRLSEAVAEAAAADEPLVAVLPFDNLTGDASLDYFSDGLSEEILYTLAKSTSLKVIGRSSSFTLRGARKSPAAARALLGATHVLDGSVRRGGERVRIAAQLMACEEPVPLWSDRFDRPLADVFAVQDEMAAAIAVALAAAFSPPPPRSPIDPEAYTLYLRARDPATEWFVPNAALLEQAVARAPRFAQAWAFLAYSRAMSIRWGLSVGPFAQRRGAVVKAAQTALALDPSVGTAWIALATIEPVCGHFSEHRVLVDKALAAAPNDPVVLCHACGMMDIVGRQADALALIERAYALDPRSVGWYHAYMLEAVGRADDARRAYDADLARWPDVLVLNANAMRSAYESGDWERYDRLSSGLPADMASAPLVALVRGAAERLRRWCGPEAEATVGELRAQLAVTGTVSLGLAALLASCGRADQAHEILERASFAHLFTPEGHLPPSDFGLNIIFSPLARALRRDRRFARLCVALGLGDFWARSGEWPDCAAELAPHYDLETEIRRWL